MYNEDFVRPGENIHIEIRREKDAVPE